MRDLGGLCFSDIPEEVSSIREFSTAMIVDGTAKCLHLINDEIQVPSAVPASMSARFRLGTTLASACQVCCICLFVYLFIFHVFKKQLSKQKRSTVLKYCNIIR